MPIRRPETGHEALFTAHRRTRHLNAIAEAQATAAEAPSPAPSDTGDDAPVAGGWQKKLTGTDGVAGGETAMRIGANIATKDTPPRRLQRSGSTTKAATSADKVITIKMVVPYPAPGTSPVLDALAAEIGEDAAVRSLLRRAFDDFRSLLEAGEMPEALLAYDEAQASIATTRRISRRAHEIAVQHLDPSRLLSDRAFARLLARRALARFFEAERQKFARRA